MLVVVSLLVDKDEVEVVYVMMFFYVVKLYNEGLSVGVYFVYGLVNGVLKLLLEML